jgi:hypothetical protein
MQVWLAAEEVFRIVGHRLLPFLHIPSSRAAIILPCRSPKVGPVLPITGTSNARCALRSAQGFRVCHAGSVEVEQVIDRMPSIVPGCVIQ